MTRNMLRGAAWIAAALIAMAPGLSARQDGQDPTRPVVEVQDLVKQIRERGALLVERLKEKSPQIAERLQKALLKINEETIREKLDEILAELRKKNPDNAAELASQVAASRTFSPLDRASGSGSVYLGTLLSSSLTPGRCARAGIPSKTRARPRAIEPES